MNSSRNRYWHARFSLTETQRFLLLALLIGMFAGLLVVWFHICIDLVSWTYARCASGRFRFARLLAPP